jgi:hypothetical protein
MKIISRSPIVGWCPKCKKKVRSKKAHRRFESGPIIGSDSLYYDRYYVHLIKGCSERLKEVKNG